MNHPIRRLACTVALGFACSAGFNAQRNAPPAADVPGSWVAWEGRCGTDRPTAPEWDRQMRAVAEIVRACPVFQGLRGYFPQMVGCASVPSPAVGGPGISSVMLLPWWPRAIELGPKGEPRVKKEWLYNVPAGLIIGINTLGDLAHWFVVEDAAGRFYEQPDTRREIAGFPVVGDRLIVTPPGKPPVFAPVNQERALRWVIANLRKQADADRSILASAQSQYDEFVSAAGKARRQKAIEAAVATVTGAEGQAAERKRLETIDRRREQDLKAATSFKPGGPEAITSDKLSQLESRLKALSPEARQQPAWFRHNEPVRRLDYGDVVTSAESGTRPLVVVNPAYFSRTLPPTAMQLVSVDVDNFESRVKSGDTTLQARIPLTAFEQIDWRALAALLK